MGRPVPLWVLLFCFLVWALGTMMFGWAVKSTMEGSNLSGPFGKAAVSIANFPRLTKDVLVQLFNEATENELDINLRAERASNADYADFKPMPVAPGVDVDGLLMRGDQDTVAKHWRLLSGAFIINGELENGAVLISPDLEIVQSWILDEVKVGDLTPRPKFRKIVHGVETLRDGSLIYTFDGSVSLQRVDYCGVRQWATPGEFHHSVTAGHNEETVWTLDAQFSIVQVSVEDGSVVRRLDMNDVIAANPMIDIFELRRDLDIMADINSRNTTGDWLDDPFHFNDVDPLPAALADAYEAFDAGDLLVSARSLNLVFVMDSDTLKVKWWRAGAVQRQHDPDWMTSGEILVFNNRMSRDYSEIVAIDPATMSKRTVYDGRKDNFYTRIRGKMQQTQDGVLVVASPQQGRAFEVGPDGEIQLEIINVKPGSDDTNYVITDMTTFPLGALDIKEDQCEIVN